MGKLAPQRVKKQSDVQRVTYDQRECRLHPRRSAQLHDLQNLLPPHQIHPTPALKVVESAREAS